MTALIELRGVGRRYGAGSTSTSALGGVDLAIDRGEFVAIVGPSGAGKSTLLNILGLLDTPTQGSYRVDGVDTTALTERARDRLRSRTFGFVFQSSHVLGDDSVARNAAVALRIQGVALPAQRARVGEVLHRLGLVHRAAATGRSLSGGERQRLAIARAVSTRPRVILADEPTGNLDTANSDEVIRLLSSLHADGTTVIVITHDERVAAAAHRRVSVSDGRVISDVRRDAAEIRGGAARETPMRASRRRAAAGVLSDALSSLTLRPARAFFLLLAFLVGTGGLVAATGLGETAANQVSHRLAQAALDQVVVTLPHDDDADARSASETRAIDRIRELSGVHGVARSISIAAGDAHLSTLRPGSVERRGDVTTQVVGGDDELLAISDVTTSPASAATLFDESVDGRFAVVGEKAADDLGIGTAQPGATIWIGDEPVAVVGFITETGRSPELETAVYVSHGVSDQVSGTIRNVIVRTELGYPAPLADVIPTAVDPGSPGSVTVDTVADLRSLRRGVATDLGALVAGISWLLLGLAAISASAIMFLSVQSRVPEIGLRRALGASRTATTTMFILEGLLIGTAGGLAGVAAGLTTVIIISASRDWIPILSPATIGIGIGIGAITGVAASVPPALRAATVDPAQAVRT